MNITPDTWSSDTEALRARITRLEAQSEARKIQTVYCACGQYEYFSQASIGGACDTDYHADYDKHLQEAENE